MQESQEALVQPLGWEDPLEKEMATYSNILAWKKPRDRGTLWATVVHGITKRNDLATEQQQQILKGILWKERYGISSLFRNGPRKPMWESW